METKENVIVPKRIVSLHLRDSVPIGGQESTWASIAVGQGNTGNCDFIVPVETGSKQLIMGQEFVAPGNGIFISKAKQDLQRPGSPKVLHLSFIPWSNIKGAIYG